MAAPEFVPVPPTSKARTYSSPDHVPQTWTASRPGDLDDRQPQGRRLGFQGPDQGFGLVLAKRFKGRLHLTSGEDEHDAIAGCNGVGLRRASLFGRAPVIHDMELAFTVWGFLAPEPPAELVTLRRSLFTGVGHTAHHYFAGRDLVDRVPEATLRMTPKAAQEAFAAGRWRDLIGA